MSMSNIIVQTVDDKLKSLLMCEKNIYKEKDTKPSLMSLLNISLQTNFLLLSRNDFNFCKEYLKAIER
jgi:hypothetical protein